MTFLRGSNLMISLEAEGGFWLPFRRSRFLETGDVASGRSWSSSSPACASSSGWTSARILDRPGSAWTLVLTPVQPHWACLEWLEQLFFCQSRYVQKLAKYYLNRQKGQIWSHCLLGFAWNCKMNCTKTFQASFLCRLSIFIFVE